MNQRERIKSLIIIYLVGFFGHMILPLRPVMIFLTSPVLLITGVLALKADVDIQQKRFMIWVVIIFVITFVIEAVGVHTGSIFGRYVYSNALGPRFASVPLIIGFNWVVVIFCSIRLGQYITRNKLASGLAASLFAVAYDGVLEPVAIRLGYWTWQTGRVPVQNYLVWWMLSVVCILLYHVCKVQGKGPVPAIYYGIQFTYFLFLALALWALEVI